MAGTPRGSKCKSTAAGAAGASSTKKQRGPAGKGKSHDTGGANSTGSGGAGVDPATGAASGGEDPEDKESGARRRNPHGIAPSDVNDAAKPTQVCVLLPLYP